MAQGLRPRQLISRAFLPPLLALVTATACGGARAPEPRAVDTTTIPENALVDAVLDECHRPLRGALDRIVATVRWPDGSNVRVFAELPDKLRTATETDRFLLRDGAVVRLGEGPRTIATESETQRVKLLALLLDATAFGPLHRAKGCRRLGAAEFAIDQPTGPAFRLVLRANTLLPERLVGPDAEVHIVDWLRTSSTWMGKRAEVKSAVFGDSGVCEIRFDLADLAWEPDLFTPPEARAVRAPRAARQMPLATGAESQSAVPFLVDGRAARRVVFADPGDWPARAVTYAPVHAELSRQDQIVAGFPQYFRDGDRNVMAQPFRTRDGGPTFAPPADWTIRDVPAGRWLVVYPANGGDLATRIDGGERLLRTALEEAGLQATGPVVTQPFLRLEEGAPPPAKLADPVVRMSVPVK